MTDERPEMTDLQDSTIECCKLPWSAVECRKLTVNCCELVVNCSKMAVKNGRELQYNGREML